MAWHRVLSEIDVSDISIAQKEILENIGHALHLAEYDPKGLDILFENINKYYVLRYQEDALLLRSY